MYFDWITWGIWTFGLALLIYWCIETVRELRTLFARRKSGGSSGSGS